MLLRHSFLCALVLAFIACNTGSRKTENTELKSTSTVQSESDKVDKDFNAFIEKFSKDAAFQLARTNFPLPVKHYDTGNENDTILYVERSAFVMMDFRKKKSDGRYDQWKQEIVLDKNSTRATIQIRGIDNGIMVDYDFEKRDGRWMFVKVDDAST